MKISTRKIIGIFLILLGLVILICFNHIFQFYTLVNSIAVIIFIVGIICIFKEKLIKANQKGKNKIDKVIKTTLFFATYIVLVLLLIGLQKVGHQMNKILGDILINSNPISTTAEFDKVKIEPLVFSVKSSQTKFYIFKYFNDKNIVISGLETNDLNTEFKSNSIDIGNNSITVKTDNLLVPIEYSADFPSFFRIK